MIVQEPRDAFGHPRRDAAQPGNGTLRLQPVRLSGPDRARTVTTEAFWAFSLAFHACPGVSSAELAVERVQHRVLEVLAPCPGTSDPATAARDNLAGFASRTGIPADAAPLAVLLRAAS